MDRDLFDSDHDAFRESVRTFIAKEVSPHYEKWDKDGIVPRELFTKSAELGVFMAVPEEYGGAGVKDFRYNTVLAEESARAGVGPAMGGPGLVADVCMPYLLDFTTDEQKERWLPGVASGEKVVAIAMTEPGAGSDLSGIRTRAVRDGDDYVVNGSKVFITNGINADLVITVVRTGDDPHRGLSLLVIEGDTEGFTRGRNLDKIGMHAQDTAELSFDDARVPAKNLLGQENLGFFGLTANLPQERLSIAVGAIAMAQAALDWTQEYVKDRKAFGRSIGSFQATRHRLADLVTEVEITQTYVDKAVLELNAERLSAVDAAKAKLWTTELLGRTLDACVQLHGGYGYMQEYPVARAWADARISRIYGGTSEIMREIIGRSLDLK
ncbi:alkylation response protein AidB-like acyl-CoA dehydrogenase [Knoellia remsis]|uniref:Acyl-[acyl-carrier-protein] dehydrogenase MbtN n=1 Tax=Knoellia remsis TaxID=407159 RepID=A0A2T0UGJ3_9MICO|nr:acyl-CoA dehydrogenase family protein [Knoellia remsis]PRY57059.1 alkylation response protein AidB-like acyl-CoA dehydrogenase [Knoellia remsis]